MKKRQSLQQVMLGKLDSYMGKNEITTFSKTTYKNKLKACEESETFCFCLGSLSRGLWAAD